MTKATKYSFFTLFFAMCIAFAQAQDKELAISADNYYKSKQYRQASWQYAQLVSNHPADNRYQYLYGVSRVLSGVNVSDAIKHLEKASMDANTPKDVYYYLGIAYQLTYDFDQSMRMYQIFKKYTGQELLAHFGVDMRIQQCKTGLRIKQLGDKYTTLEKNNDELANIAGNLYSENGRVIKIAETFQSNFDKKANEPQFLFLESNGLRVFYSSKGADGSYNSDIFCANKKGAEKYDKPQRLQAPVNTSEDEVYPTTSQSGKTIYFSAKNTQSIGGYDIFKSVWNDAANNWGQPENLGMPVNSPFDDYFFMPDSGDKIATFLTNRDCEPGKLQRIKISLSTKDEGKIFIKGIFNNADRPEDLQGKLLFYDAETYKLLTEVQPDPKTGGYEIKLPQQKKYACKVDKIGFTFLIGEFFIDAGYSAVEQEVNLAKNNQGKETVSIKIKYPSQPDVPVANKPQTIDQMLAASKAAKNATVTKSNVDAQATSVNHATAKPIVAKLNAENNTAQNSTVEKTVNANRTASVETIGSKLFSDLTETASEQKIKQTCNWKSERNSYAQRMKVRPDAEMDQIAKDKLNQKDKKDDLAQKQKQDAAVKNAEQIAQSLNLDDISFEELQKQELAAKSEKSFDVLIKPKAKDKTKTNDDVQFPTPKSEIASESRVMQSPEKTAQIENKPKVAQIDSTHIAKSESKITNLEERKPIQEIKLASNIETTKVEVNTIKQTPVKSNQQKNIPVKDLTKGIVEEKEVAVIAKPVAPVVEERKQTQEIKLASNIETTKFEVNTIKQTPVKSNQQKNIPVKDLTKGIVEEKEVAVIAKPVAPVVEERKQTQEIKLASNIETTKVEGNTIKQTSVKSDQQKNISAKEITKGIAEEKEVVIIQPTHLKQEPVVKVVDKESLSQGEILINKLKSASVKDYKERYAVSIRRNFKVFENFPEAQFNSVSSDLNNATGLKP